MPRPKGPATLNELMGKDNTITMEKLPEILGEKMPEIPNNEQGKIRLLKALRQRFGDEFRNIKGVKELISKFESNLKFEKVIAQNRRTNANLNQRSS